MEHKLEAISKILEVEAKDSKEFHRMEEGQPVLYFFADGLNKDELQAFHQKHEGENVIFIFSDDSEQEIMDFTKEEFGAYAYLSIFDLQGDWKSFLGIHYKDGTFYDFRTNNKF